MYERTTDVPSLQYLNTFNSKLGRQHTKSPLVAAITPLMSLLYPPCP